MHDIPLGAQVVATSAGTTAVFEIDPNLYSEEVALKAAYWLTERCYVDLRRTEGGQLVADIRMKENNSDLAGAVGEFRNSLIDFALRARVAAETADIQEALLQRAFIELMPKRG